MVATQTGKWPVIAHVYGPLAAHKATGGDRGWVITHIRTGLALPYVFEKQLIARRCAKHIVRLCNIDDLFGDKKGGAVNLLRDIFAMYGAIRSERKTDEAALRKITDDYAQQLARKKGVAP